MKDNPEVTKTKRPLIKELRSAIEPLDMRNLILCAVYLHDDREQPRPEQLHVQHLHRPKAPAYEEFPGGEKTAGREHRVLGGIHLK